ncbi:hypothetical protein BT63DRAFT_451327 [Microthyrium microscopicum]|uniref:FAD-binding domain-containing protein n=1 Tax=Microthyrium microscopicum TaxID=703497 RepID=A0A6A6UP96_9PEZI|nr:hypothetical protein BT63DRAFT_451327 [Microthyrium microscopicum]
MSSGRICVCLRASIINFVTLTGGVAKSTIQTGNQHHSPGILKTHASLADQFRDCKSLTKVDTANDGQQIKVYVEDGSSVSGDTVIGCDGVWGPTRSILLSAEDAELESIKHNSEVHCGAGPAHQQQLPFYDNINKMNSMFPLSGTSIMYYALLSNIVLAVECADNRKILD